jgi:hypothetical protein
MSDRKYRHRGYRDDSRDSGRPASGDATTRRVERPPGAPANSRRQSSEGARNPTMMGYREATRCVQCGAPVDTAILPLSACKRCGQALRACVQCVSFDPGARLECTQPITARVLPKDAANDCPRFSPRTTVERETSSSAAPTSASSAKKAFDDLFK